MTATLTFEYVARDALGGTQDGTLEAASRERYVPRYLLALVHCGLGERDAALRELARSVDERSDFVLGARFNPLLDSLRPDSRLTDCSLMAPPLS